MIPWIAATSLTSLWYTDKAPGHFTYSKDIRTAFLWWYGLVATLGLISRDSSVWHMKTHYNPWYLMWKSKIYSITGSPWYRRQGGRQALRVWGKKPNRCWPTFMPIVAFSLPCR